ARIRRDGNFADTLTDALCVIISEADKNPYLRQVIDAPSVQTLASSPASRAYRLNRSYWQGMMQRAAAAGQLADDLSLDEIVSWLLMMQSVLQLRLASGQIDAAQLHRLVRRFAVAPLLKSV
ncbi:MAG TPA: hypothetical protein VFF94_04230, partial [Novosphingobium sp.]|nr:hypothetical protein [Novosphingobium sp.]